MTATTVPQKLAKLRKAVSISAWATLALLITGGLLALPQAPSTGVSVDEGAGVPPLLSVHLAFFAISILVLWISAVWHAAIDPGPRPGQRIALLAALAAGSFVGGLLYYFLYLMWRKEGP